MAEAAPDGDVPRTRLALLAAVGLVAVTAGCGAVLPGSGSGGSGPSGPNAGLEPAEPPYEPSLEDSSLVADHVDALRDAGTFTVERDTTIESDSGNGPDTTRRVRVGLDDGVVAWTQRPSPVVQLYRLPDGTSYLSTVADGSRSFRENSTRSRDPADWARHPVTEVVSGVAFEHAGVTERRGERVHVYRATDPAALNESAFRLASAAGDVVSLNATLHVRESGLVARLSGRYVVELAGSEQSYAWRTRFTGLGETDTSPPAWVDDARAATRNASG